MSAADIRERFPGYETDELPQSGPWFTGEYEDAAGAAARAERVARWLKSDSLQKDVGREVLVLVMHGGFIDVLVKALVGLNSADGMVAGGAEFSDDRSGASFPFPNTATGFMELDGAGVTVRWLGRVDHLELGKKPAMMAFAPGKL